MKKVSIITATFNRAHLLPETYQSILDQTHDNWEWLVIDDGSSDRTKELMDFYTHSDTRIKYFARPDSYKKGLPGCRNYGLDMATGEFIAFVDDDDLLHSQHLEICQSTLSDSKADFIFFQLRSFSNSHDLKTQTIHSKCPFQESIDASLVFQIVNNTLPLASCSLVWKRSAIGSDRFVEELQYAEEWEFYTRLVLKGRVGVKIAKVLYFNRKHTHSNTGEFWSGSPLRRNSKIRATQLIIDNLSDKNLLSDQFIRYFIGLSRFLNSPKILNHLFTKLRRRPQKLMLYKLYSIFLPLLVAGHRLRKRFISPTSD